MMFLYQCRSRFPEGEIVGGKSKRHLLCFSSHVGFSRNGFDIALANIAVIAVKRY